MESNNAIDHEYMLSAQKEEEIKKAFERIKKETGINTTKEDETKELLNVFINLYDKVYLKYLKKILKNIKNKFMSDFVDELTKEVEELENKINEKKVEKSKFSFFYLIKNFLLLERNSNVQH